MGVLDAGALAEQRVGFVEEQDPVAVACLVEEGGEVLLGFADVFRHHGGQVHAVDVAAGGLAQQGGGEGLAGAGRTVEQHAVAGAQAAGHGPVVHQGAAVADPVFQFGDALLYLRFEDQVVPVQRRGDAPGRKAGAEGGCLGAAESEAFHPVAGHDDAAGENRRSVFRFLQTQHAFAGEPVVGGEQFLHVEAHVEIVAGEKESGGLAGGQEGAAVRIANAADLRKVALAGQRRADFVVQQRRSHMGRESQQEHGVFGEHRGVLADEGRQLRAVLVELQAQVGGLVAGKARADQRTEEVQAAIDVADRFFHGYSLCLCGPFRRAGATRQFRSLMTGFTRPT
ncbi:hypothetical protein D3C76_952340 [compost metagenome]